MMQSPPNLDLDEEGGEHEGEGSAVDDKFLAAYFTRFFFIQQAENSRLERARMMQSPPPDLDLDEEGGEHEGE
jgi:hypothetical protein